MRLRVQVAEQPPELIRREDGTGEDGSIRFDVTRTTVDKIPGLHSVFAQHVNLDQCPRNFMSNRWFPMNLRPHESVRHMKQTRGQVVVEREDLSVSWGVELTSRKHHGA